MVDIGLIVGGIAIFLAIVALALGGYGLTKSGTQGEKGPPGPPGSQGTTSGGGSNCPGGPTCLELATLSKLSKIINDEKIAKLNLLLDRITLAGTNKDKLQLQTNLLTSNDVRVAENIILQRYFPEGYKDKIKLNVGDAGQWLNVQNEFDNYTDIKLNLLTSKEVRVADNIILQRYFPEGYKDKIRLNVGEGGQWLNVQNELSNYTDIRLNKLYYKSAYPGTSSF
jgi:hypothetical protein